MVSAIGGECSVDGCLKPAARAGLCGAHRKRKLRLDKGRSSKPVDGALRPGKYDTPLDRVREALRAYENCDAGDAEVFELARRRYIKALQAWSDFYQDKKNRRRDKFDMNVE